MGRNAIYCGVTFAVVGFIAAVYALSWGTIPNLPLPLLLLMCPAATLAALAPTADPAPEFMWMLTALNAILYGALGTMLATLLHLDDVKDDK
jgi:hypothetical protein